MDKHSQRLLDKLRTITPYEVKEKIKLVSDELSSCVGIFQENYVSDALEDIFVRINKMLDMVLDEWDWMEFLEIPVMKEEIELCKKVCAIYAQNPQLADCEQICVYPIRYNEEFHKIIDA